MQEIAPNIFIDRNSYGLITGIIRTDEGTVLIDSPVRQEELHPWRSGTAHPVQAMPRFLVILDTNYDRLLSAKGLDNVMIAQANSTLPAKPKPAAAKTQEDQAYSSEAYDSLNGSVRQISPDIIFQQDLGIFLGSMELRLEHHPGANSAGVWVELPQQKVLFIGDTIMGDQPTFLAYFNAEAWLADLEELKSERFQGYQIISSRIGVVTSEQIDAMSQTITFIWDLLKPLMEGHAKLEEILNLIPQILARYDFEPLWQDLYYNRLRWGLTTYYENHHS